MILIMIQTEQICLISLKGWVESLLSHDIFGSLARTSYSSYISSMFVAWMHSGGSKKEADSSSLSIVSFSWENY